MIFELINTIEIKPCLHLEMENSNRLGDFFKSCGSYLSKSKSLLDMIFGKTLIYLMWHAMVSLNVSPFEDTNE